MTQRQPIWRMSRSRLRRAVYRRLANAAQRVHGRGPLLVATGDSLTDPSCAYTLPRQVWLRVVGRKRYRTFNLGVSGDTTADMRSRVEQMLAAGRPEIAVVFGGSNDAFRGLDLGETEGNVAFILAWLRDHGVEKLIVIGPGLLNWEQPAESAPALQNVGDVLARVADSHGAAFVDLAAFLRNRIDGGQDPDFARVPYRQSRSWHLADGDPHFNAYGQRLVAAALLAAIADWLPPHHRPGRASAG